MITVVYFFLAIFSFAFITWMMIESLGTGNYPSNGDDDGGLYDTPDFPLIDVPPGGSIDDLLVDRMPEDIFQRDKVEDLN